MVKNFFKKYGEQVACICAAIAVMSVLFFGVGGVIKADASLPIVETEYEILTVYQYSTPITNGYGGIKGHSTRYHVTYITKNGGIREIEMANNAHIENAYEAVYMGEESKLVITSKGSNPKLYRLYLTETDFEEMQYKLIDSE